MWVMDFIHEQLQLDWGVDISPHPVPLPAGARERLDEATQQTERFGQPSISRSRFRYRYRLRSRLRGRIEKAVRRLSPGNDAHALCLSCSPAIRRCLAKSVSVSGSESIGYPFWFLPVPLTKNKLASGNRAVF